MTPTEAASSALVGDHGVAGVVQVTDTYRTSLWAFPFSAIATNIERQELLSATLEWCGYDPHYYQFYLPVINP